MHDPLSIALSQNPNGLIVDKGSRCRFCRQPAIEKYRYWVATWADCTHNSDIGNSDRTLITTTYKNVACHDVSVCQPCQDAMWRDEKKAHAIAGVVSVSAFVGFAYLFGTIARLLTDAGLHHLDLTIVKGLLAIAALGLLAWGSWKLLGLVRFRTFERMEGLILRRMQPSHVDEGDTFFTDTEYLGRFRRRPC